MNWINTKDKHFVDIEEKQNGSYLWEQNDNCPNEPFLVGLWVFDNKKSKTKFETHLVVLTDNGLEEWTEDDTYPLDCWEITDFEFWCKIESPETVA